MIWDRYFGRMLKSNDDEWGELFEQRGSGKMHGDSDSDYKIFGKSRTR